MRQAVAPEGLHERVAPLLLEVLALLAREPVADLVARPRRRDDAHPVARRPALGLRRQDLDDLAGLQRVVQRHDAPVDLRADAAMPDVGVHRVGEVERRRTRRQRLDLAGRREDEDLVVEQVDAQRVEEVAAVALTAPWP